MGFKVWSRRNLVNAATAAALAVALAACSKGPADGAASGKIELLNVSYDPTRELYEDINPKFVAKWKAETGQDVTVNMSHGGSGKQARAIIDGLDADVATLALAQDIDEISAKGPGIVAKDWQGKLPEGSAPYTSTIVFLVRTGNPKGIRDWGDLIKPDVSVITPNPKTSGGARWNFLAAWAYAKKAGGSDAAAEAYIRKLFANVPVLDSGARGATTTFAERGIGDVLLAWENEAYLAQEELGKGKFEIVVPSISILAQPSVAVLDGNAQRHGTQKVARAYLDFLYTPEAQAIIARHHFRPVDKSAQGGIAFPTIDLVTIDKDFGGWAAAQKRFFDDGGVFDRIYGPAKN